MVVRGCTGQAHGQAPGHGQPDHLAVAPVRRGLTHSRRAERHRSDTSLSNRDSASSLSEDFSGTNTFKVNALAAFTPRPLIRYVDPPRLPSTSRSQNASAASTRRERLPALTVSEENLSKRRIDRLADDLDAGGLRELLERDRRRQELKIIRDNERAQRKLERSTFPPSMINQSSLTSMTIPRSLRTVLRWCLMRTLTSVMRN